AHAIGSMRRQSSRSAKTTKVDTCFLARTLHFELKTLRDIIPSRPAENPRGKLLSAPRAIGFGLAHLPRIVRGEGSYLFDAQGRQYLDGSGGPAAFCIGHANREVIAAIATQLERIACAYRYLFTTEVMEELTALIL